MKLKTVKKRFIASKAKYIVCPKRGQQEYMIDFCGRVWGVEGVER
jgi:hypothetical protein